MSLQLAADSATAYDHFVSRVLVTGVVWGLKSENVWAVCPSNETEADVYLFWSDEAYARRHCINEWAHYLPASIPLTVFRERWLPGMAKDGFLVGPQYNSQLCGVETHPDKVAADLERGL